MLRQTITAARLLAALTLLTGVVYPLVVTGIARLVAPAAAAGSLVDRTGRPAPPAAAVGSALIGQDFRGDRYLWGRPSATAPRPYQGDASGGSNLGPLHPDITAAAEARLATLAAGGAAIAAVPVDLVTASASGLDPHISPAAAAVQIARIARARGIPEDRVREVVRRHTVGRTLGILGEPRVNVLLVNLALDAGE